MELGDIFDNCSFSSVIWALLIEDFYTFKKLECKTFDLGNIWILDDVSILV